MKTTKMIKTGLVLLSVIASVSLMSACQMKNQGGRTFTTSQAQTAMRAFHGKISHVSEVQIQHNASAVGAVAGGVIGGAVGTTIGSGRRASTLATTGGTAAGAAIGSAADRIRGTRAAWELEVELESGEVLVIVQEQDDDVFKVGDNVRVIEGRDGSFRVRQ